MKYMEQRFLLNVLEKQHTHTASDISAGKDRHCTVNILFSLQISKSGSLRLEDMRAARRECVKEVGK